MLALARVRRTLVATVATLDERSLGLGRIVLALALLVDLGKRIPVLRAWYTNEGLLPNHTLLWSPPYEHTFSFFFMASHWYEAAFGFVLCAVAYLFLLVGYRTRLAQVLSFVAVTSLHGRVMFLQIGGDVALGELAFWTLFLPLERRFSVDSLLERLRFFERGESAKERPHAVVSLACFTLLFQLTLVYAFNAWQKSGRMWLDGSLVHYVLHIDGLVTRLGYAIRDSVTPGVSAFLTHSARIGEAIVPLALLFPVVRGPARIVAVATIVVLHVGFALLMNVGLFSLAMIAYTPNFLPSGFWDFMEARRAGRTSPGETVPAVSPEAFAEGVRRVAKKPGTLLDVLLSLPFGETLADLAKLPYAKRVLRRLARAAVARAERDNEAERTLTEEPATSRFRPWLERAAAGVMTLSLYLSWAQAGVENDRLPNALKLPLPAWGTALVHYLQLYQGWHMFSPEATRIDIALAVDAVTKDGRHVDPWNEFARPHTRPPGDRIPPRLGNDVFVNSYLSRIAETPAYHTAFSDWIFRYSERTGRPGDEIVSFTASMLTDDSPPPGEREHKNPRRQVFLSYPPQK